MTEDDVKKLSDPFPPEQIGKLPRAGIKLDFVGHGHVTQRLLEVDPEWTWEPLAVGTDGLPAMERDSENRPIAMWGRMTVLGVTRPGVGCVAAGTLEAEKHIISDFIRNAAMRFGVALDLWAKEREPDTQSGGSAPSRGGSGLISDKQTYLLDKLFKESGIAVKDRPDWVAGVIDRSPSSMAALTKTEASKLIEQLKEEEPSKLPDMNDPRNIIAMSGYEDGAPLFDKDESEYATAPLDDGFNFVEEDPGRKF